MSTDTKTPSAGAMRAAQEIYSTTEVGNLSGAIVGTLARIIDRETRCAELEAALRNIHKCVTNAARYYAGNLDPIWRLILRQIPPDLESK